MNSEKSKILQFYLSNIKPYSDKIPYFRRLAKSIWKILWKFKLKLRSLWLSANLEKIYWINPRYIYYGMERDELMVPNYEYREKKPYRYGDSFHNIIRFEDKLIYRSFYEHFIEGKKWKETEFYKRVINKIKNGHCIWCYSSVSEYNRRCKKLDKLYYAIKKNGIEIQYELNETSLLRENMIKEIQNEIIVYIGPDGELIHRNGQHRLVIAKLLNLDKVPIQILYRDKEWMKFRKKILTYIKKEMSGEAYHPLLHPDLNDTPSLWSDKRFEIIRDNLGIKMGTLLDIGAHWGYFCHKFEEIGFQCTAMEDSQKNLYFLKKLRRASNANFKVFNKSIFDSEDYAGDGNKLTFDIVLALNVFNQFTDITEKDLYLKLIKLFNRVKAKEMYLQVPDEIERMQHTQVKDKCGKINRNYSTQGIIDFIINNSGFDNVDRIGEERSYGIYKLY